MGIKGLRVLNAKVVISDKFTGKNLGGEIVKPSVSYFSEEGRRCWSSQQGRNGCINLAVHRLEENESDKGQRLLVDHCGLQEPIVVTTPN